MASAREALATEFPRPLEVPGPDLPSRIIGTEFVEMFGVRPCEDCGAATEVVGVRAEGREDKYGTDRLGGRTIKWSRGQICPACQARRLIDRQGNPKVRRLDRGVKRADLEAARDHNRGRAGSSIGTLTAEILGEILAANPGDRVTKESMRAHPFAGQIEPVIVNLDDDASPAGAAFRAGPVTLAAAVSGMPIDPAMLWGRLDLHCTGDGGLHGPLAPLGDLGRFAMVLAPVGQQNHRAIEGGRGVVRSRWAERGELHAREAPTHRFTYYVDIFTFIEHGQSATTILCHPG